MANDRRTKQKLTLDDVYDTLNNKQLAALRESQIFGWRVKFIRKPLFQEPVPVVYNARYDKIGIMEPDGRINMEPEFEVRCSVPPNEQQQLPQEQEPQEQQPQKTDSWKEKRKGMEPIPGNFEEILSPIQLRALRKIERFGWKLHFIRRASELEESVVVIRSPKGDKIATLEQDGRIQLMPDSVARKDVPTEQIESASPVQATKK